MFKFFCWLDWHKYFPLGTREKNGNWYTVVMCLRCKKELEILACGTFEKENEK